jgi:hypothetical protein
MARTQEDKVREHPDNYDAELLLRLYDLRRETKLRQAREWLIREFHADSLEEMRRRYQPGSQEHAFFRMVTSYWEMAASMVSHSLIKEEFFFENTNELWVVWQKIKHLAPATRQMYKNPHVWKNLETIAGKFEAWMAQRAPEATEALRKIVVEAAGRK